MVSIRSSDQAHAWHPVLFPLVPAVLCLAVLLVMLTAVLAYSLFARPLGLHSVLLLAMAVGSGLALYWQLRWVHRLLGARYFLTPDVLVLYTEGWQQEIPLASIYRVVTGDSLPEHLVETLFFGYRRGYGRVRGIGEAWFLTTSASRDHLTVITTDTGSYVLSPADVGTLMRELANRGVPLAPGRLPRAALRGHRIRLPFGRDRRALALLALGVVANLGMVAFVAWRYADLPPFLPLHYNAIGQVDFIGTPGEAFRLPGIAAGLLLGNVALAILIRRYERVAAHMFLAAGILVQMVMLVATINLLR